MRYLLLLLLTGCAAHMRYVPIDYSRKPPADWPQLEQRVVYSKTIQELRDQCGASNEASGKYLACSQLYFDAGLCMIYVGPQTATDVLEHEREHCRGYDHRGYSRGADAWDLYKARASK